MPISMTIRQEQRQTIKTILTLTQQHSLRVLTMPQAKLDEMIDEVAIENPFIKMEAWDGYLNQRSAGNFAMRGTHEDDSMLEVQQTLARKSSLIEHLTRQLCESRLTCEDKNIAEQIIGNLDGRGYLAVSLDELASESGVPLAQVEAVLKHIQNFDPVGVASRSLCECLLVQLQHVGEGGGLAARIVTDYLDDLAARRYRKIAQDLAVEVCEVELAHKRITSLEPKPAREFDCEQVRVAIPEITVERVEDRWNVQLANGNLPRFRVNESRFRWLTKRLSVEQRGLKKSLQEQLREARLLFQAVQDRHQTLLKVTTAMFKRQEDFLNGGRYRVRPMMMKEIGEELGFNESTISRTVADKFARTPHGIFPLKFFFQDSVPRPGGPAVSVAYVKAKIAALIATEESSSPLTDDEIVKRLSDDCGIKLARRTASKYRDALKIMPASQRRRDMVPSDLVR